MIRHDEDELPFFSSSQAMLSLCLRQWHQPITKIHTYIFHQEDKQDRMVLFFFPPIIWVSLSLFIYVLSCFFCPNLTIFFPSLSLARYLLGSVGPTTNQPSRVLHDKQVNDRTSVIGILFLYVIPWRYSQSACNRKWRRLDWKIFISLSFNWLPTFLDICREFPFAFHLERKKREERKKIELFLSSNKKGG